MCATQVTARVSSLKLFHPVGLCSLHCVDCKQTDSIQISDGNFREILVEFDDVYQIFTQFS